MIALIPDAEGKKYYTALHARITNANSERQRLVHGIWSFDLADPHFLIVEKPGTATGAPKLLNTKGIIDFAISVSKISMALHHPGGLTWEELAKMKEEEGSYISRSALKMMTGKDEDKPKD